MTRRNRTYRLPPGADLTLKDSLSARLKELWTSAAQNSFDLYLYAAGLRKRYLDPKTGNYKDEFREWYEKQELELLLGKMPSFTKYALAGEAVNFIANEFHQGKYVDQLPITRNALYEIWHLIGITSVSDLEKLFFAGGDDAEPLIHPSASATEIAAFRNRAKETVSAPAKARSKKFSIPLATIYVSRDLYKFNRTTGSHEGPVDLTDVRNLLKLVESQIDTKLFDVRNNLTKISTAYEKRKSKASPARALRKATTTKKSEK